MPAGAVTCPVCGAPLGSGSPASFSQALPPGTVLQGKYRLEKVLGQGGFGITYAGTQTQLGMRVAVKELFPQGASRQGNTVLPPPPSIDPDWAGTKRRFGEEARAVARFSHPNIVRVFDQFEEGGTAFLVMELLDGSSLDSVIEKHGPLPPDEVQRIAAQALSALAVVHDQGMLHRDIKPGNLFLERSGRVVLIDFGSARQFVAGQATSHTRLVTPGYAPLEQYGSQAKFGPYTDIYAFGATLYHALSGQMPPAATDRMNGAPLPPLPASTPASLRRAIEKALAVRVQDRPQSAREMLELMTAPGQAASGQVAPGQVAAASPRRPAPAPAPAPTPPTPAPRRAPQQPRAQPIPVPQPVPQAPQRTQPARRGGCSPLFPLLFLGAGAYLLWNMFAPSTTVTTQTQTETTQGTDPFNPRTTEPADSLPQTEPDSGDVLFPDFTPEETTETPSGGTTLPDESATSEAAPTDLPAELPPTQSESGVLVPDLSPSPDAGSSEGSAPAPSEDLPANPPAETQSETDPTASSEVNPDSSSGSAGLDETDASSPTPEGDQGTEDASGTDEESPSTLPSDAAAPAEEEAVDPASDASAPTTPSTETGTAPDENPAAPESPTTPPTSADPASAGQAISADEAREIGERYLATNAKSGLSEAMNLYAAQVDYFGRGTLPKSVVYSDKLAYVKRWPEREYRLSSGVNTLTVGEGTRTVRFDYDYTLQAQGAQRSGTAYVVLKLVREGGEVRIAGETGGLYP